ncbi:hypothetical protein AB7Z19_26230 [Escherichia coli]|nr:hypothetical protein [Escherichia coli]
MTSLKTSIKTITYLSDIGCLEIHGASLNTSATDTDQIQAFIVSTWMAPFQNDMYSEDNPISPYYKIEW